MNNEKQKEKNIAGGVFVACGKALELKENVAGEPNGAPPSP